MYVRHLWKIDRFYDISSPKYSTRTSLKVILDMWHVMLQGPLVHYPINTLPYISTCGTSQSYTRAHKFGSIFPRVVVSHFEIGSIWFRLESASFTDGMSKCHSFIRSESIRACVLWSRVILAYCNFNYLPSRTIPNHSSCLSTHNTSWRPTMPVL